MLSCQAVDCDLSVIGSSKHCELHSKLFRPIYLKYKRLHSYVKEQLSKPLHEYDVYLLLKMSSSLQELYELRSNYRRIAFKPQYHDVGHTRVLHEVLHKLDEVRNQLTIIFSRKPVEEVPDIEIDTTEESINIVTNIRQVVVAKHKEEWDKQSQIDYEYNTQRDAKLQFLIDSSLSILAKMDISNPKHMLDTLVLLHSLPGYLKHSHKDEKLINVLFRNSIYSYIEKERVLYDVHVNIYRSLVTREPKCIIENLKLLPDNKVGIIGICSLNESIVISLHTTNQDKYFPKFKLTNDKWVSTNNLDLMCVTLMYESIVTIDNSMSGLTTREKRKRVRQIKHKAMNDK